MSALSCFHLLVVPAINKMLGRTTFNSKFNIPISNDIKLDPERPEYMRASLSWNGDQLTAVPTGIQQSSRLLRYYIYLFISQF